MRVSARDGKALRYEFTLDNEAVRITCDFRQRLMRDPSRPTYHLVNSKGNLVPFISPHCVGVNLCGEMDSREFHSRGPLLLSP